MTQHFLVANGVLFAEKLVSGENGALVSLTKSSWKQVFHPTYSLPATANVILPRKDNKNKRKDVGNQRERSIKLTQNESIMAKVENEAFDEIFYCHPVGAGRDTYRRQFVCAPHQEFVCGTCCMDFALLNDLRYDNDYLLLAADPLKRMERIRRVVDFYYMNPRAEFRRDPTKRRSPRLERLLIQFSGNTGVSVGKVIELASYLSYICRWEVAARQRICTTLDTVLLEDLYAASKNQTVQENTAYNSSDESSEGIPAPKPKRSNRPSRTETEDTPKPKTPRKVDGITKKTDGTAKKILSVQIQNLVDKYAVIFKQSKVNLRRQGVKSFGHFFDEFKMVVSDGDEEAWTRFLRKRAKTGVAATGLDPQDWPASQTRKFLDQHGLVLAPRPSKEGMAETARHVLDFSVACKNILYHYSIIKSDNCKENALGSRDENRRRVSPERQKAPRKVLGAAPSKVDTRKKVETPSFLVEPQIPLGVRLSSVSGWDMLGRFVKCHPFFVRNRMAYTRAFPLDNVFHRVLDLLELMADTYDRTLESHPPQDFLIVLTSKNDEGQETSLAIRCFGARNCGSSENPVPVLELEYLATVHDPSSSAYQALSKGIRPGVTRFINESCAKKDMELLLLMFKTNRKQLSSDDVSQNFASMVSPDWHFSVVRAADPNRRGAFPLCPCCSQSASMVCSVCREISYCSRKCQVADWKRHYQVCKMCETSEV